MNRRDEREALTRQTVRELLKKQIKRKLIGSISMYAAWSLATLFLPILLLLDPEPTGVAAVILVYALPLPLLIPDVVSAVKKWRILKKDDFEIVVDRVYNIAEEMNWSAWFSMDGLIFSKVLRYMRAAQKTFYFDQHGRYFVDRTLASYSSVGDHCYLAVSKGKIFAVFNEKIYRLEK